MINFLSFISKNIIWFFFIFLLISIAFISLIIYLACQKKTDKKYFLNNVLNTASKISQIIALVIAVLFGTVAIDAYDYTQKKLELAENKKNSEKEKKRLEYDIANLTTEKASIEDQLNKKNAEKTSIEAQLDKKNEELAKVNSELKEATDSNAIINKKLYNNKIILRDSQFKHFMNILMFDITARIQYLASIILGDSLGKSIIPAQAQEYMDASFNRIHNLKEIAKHSLHNIRINTKIQGEYKDKILNFLDEQIDSNIPSIDIYDEYFSKRTKMDIIYELIDSSVGDDKKISSNNISQYEVKDLNSCLRLFANRNERITNNIMGYKDIISQFITSCQDNYKKAIKP